MKIKPEVISVLSKSTTKDNVLYLPQIKLERQEYLDVNKCLELIGGKWNRAEKGHIFESDPSDLLDEMINTGEVTDAKKEYQFFETPKNIVKQMIELADIKVGETLLEPSAGQGAILEEFPKENPYIAVEIMIKNCEKLDEMNFEVYIKDFLELDLKADKIIMNPPFSKQQDVDHILHAWKCLNKGGRLVSIVSESPFFRENKKSQEFRSFLEDNNAEIINLDRGAFKESGTMVKSRIIVIDKETQK